jgi:hypothetical protein
MIPSLQPDKKPIPKGEGMLRIALKCHASSLNRTHHLRNGSPMGLKKTGTHEKEEEGVDPLPLLLRGPAPDVSDAIIASATYRAGPSRAVPAHSCFSRKKRRRADYEKD